MRNALKTLLKGLISVYSYLVSPLLGQNCRFHPTCSAYAREAIDRHGPFKGLLLAVRRISRCHPWHKGPMIDPVPAEIDWRGFIGYKRAKLPTDRPCGCAHHDKKEY